MIANHEDGLTGSTLCVSRSALPASRYGVSRDCVGRGRTGNAQRVTGNASRGFPLPTSWPTTLRKAYQLPPQRHLPPPRRARVARAAGAEAGAASYQLERVDAIGNALAA